MPGCRWLGPPPEAIEPGRGRRARSRSCCFGTAGLARAEATAQRRRRSPQGPQGSRPGSATRCWCAPRMSRLGAEWRSSTTSRSLEATITSVSDRALIDPGASGARRPFPRRRHRDRRRCPLRRRGALPRRCHGAHRGGGRFLRATRACALPPIRAGRADIDAVRRSADASRIAGESAVRGLLNVQYALHGDMLYVLEANPRASPNGPVRVQGERGAAGQGGRADHAGCHDRRVARRGHAAGPR